jgi:vitamin B12 transporter
MALGLGAVVLVVAPRHILAQVTDNLEEVVVRGQRLEESIPLDLQQFGNRVEVITAEQLELGGFNDVSQALQMEVPGLYLAPKNGAFDYMDCSLQGSRCQDVLWLIDGVRINNRLYNTTAPLDTVLWRAGHFLWDPVSGRRREYRDEDVQQRAAGQCIDRFRR